MNNTGLQVFFIPLLEEGVEGLAGGGGEVGYGGQGAVGGVEDGVFDGGGGVGGGFGEDGSGQIGGGDLQAVEQEASAFRVKGSGCDAL